MCIDKKSNFGIDYIASKIWSDLRKLAKELTTNSPSRSDDLIWQTSSQSVMLDDIFPEVLSARNLCISL